MTIAFKYRYFQFILLIVSCMLVSQSGAGSFNLEGPARINGPLNMNNNQIHNVADPTAAQDVASKAYVDAQKPPSMISLPVEFAVINNGAWYQINGGSDLSGMAFPDNGFPRFSTGLSLPFDYMEGADIKIFITWGNSRFNAISCGVRLRSNGVSAFRPNHYPIYRNGVFTGDINYDGSEVTLTMPDTSEQIRQTIMTIPGINATGIPIYEPGDNIVLKLARDANHPADTCSGKLYILGMYATY